MPEVQEFIDRAVSYYGVKWKDHGRTRQRGIDCVGLIVLAGREAGFFEPDFDYQNYTRHATGFKLTEVMSAHLRPRPLRQVQTGDVLAHRDDMFPCHVSIYWDRPGYGASIIHAFLGGRRCVTFDPYRNWQGRTFSTCFRLPGVA